MSNLNLGILAHVDAGKTSLTERLLFNAGVIDAVGSVDAGSTQTDSLALERQRGITIKAAVVSFAVGDKTVNLIDTPGHPDFIAEVERVLRVLDGAVLVISAVEGVQAQTRVLLRALQRLRIPTLFFVNKIDRAGARPGAVLDAISQRLSPAIVALGSVAGPGSRGATFSSYSAGDAAFNSRLVDLLTANDDALLATYVRDEAALSYRRLRRELADQTTRALVHPVFFGSAITGAGVEALTAGLRELLPAARGDLDSLAAGTVFKVERGARGEKIAYARMFGGTLRVRERLPGRDDGGRITAIRVFEHGGAVSRDSVHAGQIGKLWGLGDIRIGDAFGVDHRADGRGFFAPPMLETSVEPVDPAVKGALHVALTQLAEQDPLIDLRRDELRQEILVSLYGEVQKEVIQATLANDYGLDVEFRETTTIYVERPSGTGEAVEVLGVPPNPLLATIGLRVEPAAINSGTTFRQAVEVHGTMPHAFFMAIEETVTQTLHQGLYGWQVVDCTITLTSTGYAARQSHAHQGFDKSSSSTGSDFRLLTPLVLMQALQHAGTVVCEPLQRFRLEIPADTVGALAPVLSRLRAVPQTHTIHGTAIVLEGEVPAAGVHQLQLQLPGLTRGEGVLEATFARYAPLRGAVPSRPRTDHNPLDRKGYLLHVLRRV